MLTFNEEHEITVLKALIDYKDYCRNNIAKTERLPDHCEFWCTKAKEAQSALDHIDRYLATKEKK